jgi:hypothetical protein
LLLNCPAFWFYLCLQMCSNVSIEDKALKVDYFPEGWKFCFNVGTRDILLISARGRRYTSAEKAASHCKASDGVDVTRFNKYVGLKETTTISRVESVAPRNCKTTASRCKKALDDVNVKTNSRVEYVAPRSCGCIGCVVPPCKRCHACKKNHECFQKVCGAASIYVLVPAKTLTATFRLEQMCSNISVDDKAVLAQGSGLPKNWKFCFNDHGSKLKLISPSGRQYDSIESAMRRRPKSLGGTDFACFKLYAGLDDKDRTPSIRRSVRCFCYAKFTDGKYYRGFITKVSGFKSDRLFSVRFY